MKKWEYISTHEHDYRPARMKSTQYKDKDGNRHDRECPPKMKLITVPGTQHYTIWAYPWETWLNVLGEMGWEVCGSGVIGGKYPKITAILKREITEESNGD